MMAKENKEDDYIEGNRFIRNTYKNYESYKKLNAKVDEYLERVDKK